MYLKKYQIKVVKEFKSFFEKGFEQRNKVEQALKLLPDDLKDTLNFNWVENTFKELGKDFNDKCKNGLGEIYPRICIKMPTGGGKTLLAVETIREYQNLLAHSKTGLVVWIVPSETIYSQTVKKLRDKSNSLRQLLDQSSGNRTVILEKGQKLTTSDLQENLVVLFIMIQSISRQNAKEALKVFQDSGGYESFFPQDNRYDLHKELIAKYPNIDPISDTETFQPQIRTSLGNAIRVSEPLIIIDEIHKVFSEQARKTIDNLNPKMVIGLSATPKPEMNVLVTITGLELKEEEMVKLDLHIIPPTSTGADGWKNMLKEIKNHRDSLEKKSVKYKSNKGKYIRPIALIQVESTGRDQRGKRTVHSLDAKEHLISLGIPEHEIAIKTSSQNDIEDVDLFSRDCEIRYIITKEALREGWDCSFAYILGIIPNANSNTGVTQLVGRILRQPFAKKTKVKDLDESYVYYFRGDSREVLNKVITGFRNEGLDDLTPKVKMKDNEEVNPSKTVKIKEKFRRNYGTSFYLPVWLIVDGKSNKRRFNYHMDVKSKLDFNNYKLTKEFVKEIDKSLSEENIERKGFSISLDERSHTSYREEIEEVYLRDELNNSYFTRRLNEIIENPFLSRFLVNNIIKKLLKGLSEEKLNNHFSFIVSQICKNVEYFKEKQEEEIFLQLIRNKILVLAVSDQKEIGFKIPEVDYITTSSTPHLYKYYLFEDVEIVSMNTLEKKVGDLLDKQDKILWWFRNKVRRDWYSIEGWKENKIYPDFVVAKRKNEKDLEIVYILESKGEHLLGNKDSAYKKDLLEIMTQEKKENKIITYQQLSLPFGKINDEVEAYFVEDNDEEKTIRTFMK